MNKLNFTDRSSYLAWAQEWKEAYRAHSASIRSLKVQFRQAQREGDMSKVYALDSSVRAASRQATEMIEQRHESKVQANRQYLAEVQARAQNAVAGKAPAAPRAAA